jgi:hypothetical protein
MPNLPTESISNLPAEFISSLPEEFISNLPTMAERRANNRQYFEALEQRIEALELAEMKTVELQKRYDIPDLEAQKEKHTDNSDIIRDAIIGFADGLTVPFALTAGLSS